MQQSPLRWVNDRAGLEALPQFSVVQFRGESLGESARLVWQLDEAWFPAGSEEFMWPRDVPAESFPAAVLWMPDSNC